MDPNSPLRVNGPQLTTQGEWTPTHHPVWMDPNSPLSVNGPQLTTQCELTPTHHSVWMDTNSPVEGLEQVERLEIQNAGHYCTTTPGTVGRTHRPTDRWTKLPPDLPLPRSPPSTAYRKNCKETTVTLNNEKIRQITRKWENIWSNGLFTPAIVWTITIVGKRSKYTGFRPG